MSFDDRSAILDLLHRSGHAVDAADFDTYANLFARGSMTVGGRTMHGHDEVLAHANEMVMLYDGSPRTQHFIQNPLIEVAADRRTARAKAFVQVLQQVPPDFPLQTIATAVYHDVCHRDVDGWFLKERVAEVVLVGDLSRHSRATLAPGSRAHA